MIQPRQGLTAADGNRAHCGERDDQRPPAVLGSGLRESGYLRQVGPSRRDLRVPQLRVAW
jgi:hypothetical protein